MNVAPLVIGWYFATSLATALAYRVDKTAAARGKRRVPERWLHGLELAGGWPGGILGQRLFRHKTRKLSYQLVFWLIVASHAAFWFLWFRFRRA